MSVTTFEGTVEKGQVKLPNDIHLPEKAKVYVIVPGLSDFQDIKTTNKYDLAELVAKMPQGYQVNEENFGKPVGKEEW